MCIESWPTEDFPTLLRFGRVVMRNDKRIVTVHVQQPAITVDMLKEIAAVTSSCTDHVTVHFVGDKALGVVAYRCGGACKTPQAEIDNRRRDEHRRRAVAIIRKRVGWSQHDLGTKLGFGFSSQVRISQMENGWRPLSNETFERIADLCGLSPDDLEALGRDDTRPGQQRLLDVLRQASGFPLTIAVLCDRADINTSDGWAELEPLVNDCRVLKVHGGFVIANEEPA